jgi:RND family efflux transporter MFP subunit
VKLIILPGAVLCLALLTACSGDAPGEASEGRPSGRVAVETAPVERGSLIARRSFPGSLEADAEFMVAPKVAGQVTQVLVDIGDEVKQGQVVLSLDDDEYQQAVAQSQAELQVARARLNEAESAGQLARKSLDRITRLEEQGIVPASELDAASTDVASRQAAVSVARAEVARARSALETARTRLGYTQIEAHWPASDPVRLVGERMVDAGDTVAANTPLLSIVAVQELRAIIQVPQTVYTTLVTGRQADITTPALPGETFTGEVSRIAPRLDPESRQARVELTVSNDRQQLVPGMFVRVAIESRRVDDAMIVPAKSLVERSGRLGVFTLNEAGETALFVPAEVLLRANEQAAVTGLDNHVDEVVVLGQDQLTDGASVVRPENVGDA